MPYKHSEETKQRLSKLAKARATSETSQRILQSEGYQKRVQRFKWKQIQAQYLNQEELINLLKTKPYKELQELWHCTVDVIYTLRKKLNLGTKNISQAKLLKKYTKEELENLYLTRFDRHLSVMAEALNTYQNTLSKVFKVLGIEQRPYHPSEYAEVRQIISKKATERARETNPISHVTDTPEWAQRMAASRKANGTYTSQEYRDKIRKSHINALKKYQRFTNTSIELLLQAELKKRNIAFATQTNILDLTAVDIYIEPNICIYADGDYWHNRPEAKPRDAYVNRKLRAAGYIVHRFWEHEIKKDAKGCIDKVVAILEDFSI